MGEPGLANVQEVGGVAEGFEISAGSLREHRACQQVWGWNMGPRNKETGVKMIGWKGL